MFDKQDQRWAEAKAEWDAKVAPYLEPDPESRENCPGGPCLIPAEDAPFGTFSNQYPAYYSKASCDRAGRYARGTTPLFTVAFALAVGLTPERVPSRSSKASGSKRLNVRHLCGNHKCCNPAHLAHGSCAQNIADKAVHEPFDSAGRRRLTEREHREIISHYNAGFTQRLIADQYGITQPSVSYIVNKALARIGWLAKHADTELILSGKSPWAGLTEAFVPALRDPRR